MIAIRLRAVTVPALLLAIPLLVGCGGDRTGEARSRSGAPGPGDPAPAYAAVTLEGDSVRLSELEGDVVLLNVWATWCAPCRREIPELEALHQAHADQGLRVVGVSVDGRAAKDQVRAFMDDFDMSYAVWWDPDQSAVDAFGAVGVPLTVLIDREGRIAWRRLGVLEREDPELTAAVDSLLDAHTEASATSTRD